MAVCTRNLNPVDLGTRGLKCNEIKSTEWLTGASLLKLDQNQWPKTDLPIQENSLLTATVAGDFLLSSVFSHLWCRISSFAKISRILAYVKRFSDRLLPSRSGNQCEAQESSRSLSAPELASAELVIWKHVQAESFSNEIKALKKEQPIANSTRIAPLMPFLSSVLLRA